MPASEILLAVLGATAVWLSQDRRLSRRRWAPIFGLASQPFWFYATAAAGQWFIFALCFVYAGAWWRGFRQHWLTEVTP